jgi:hypothetical protein
MPVIVPAGMMSKPPECGGDETSARGHRNSLRRQESPAGVLVRERDAGLVPYSVTHVNGNVSIGDKIAVSGTGLIHLDSRPF